MSRKPKEPRPLGPDSSARQLWPEVQRLRTLGPRRVADEEEAERARLLADAHAREEALVRELAAARAGSEEEGVAADKVAGRPSLAGFRRTWSRFAHATLRLPDVRDEEGPQAVRLFVASELDSDLYLLSLTAPRGEREADERDRVRRAFDSPAMLAVLSRRERWADRFRAAVLSTAARSFFRPSVWATFDKAAEEGRLDRYGEVLK